MSQSFSEEAFFEKVVNLCKRRGFVFPSAEIYGGFKSTYDFGPLGVALLRNIKNLWWDTIVNKRADVVGIDAAILSSPKIWETSGHLANFTDPLVDCKNCKERFRPEEGITKCPKCSSTDLTQPRAFNLMFKTYVGPVENESNVAYLRPETAQGMFVNFQNVVKTMRLKPPFGIAQIGKSFRNEISPGNFIFRTREFEQMELEYFVPPNQADEWFSYWLEERFKWYVSLGIPESKLRIRHHSKEELAHYSKQTADIEFLFPWGWGELEGIANRTDFDLRAHSNASGKDLTYFDQATNSSYFPFVIEPAAGANRSMMAFLIAAYDEDIINSEKRTVLRLCPDLAPYKVAVLPLSKNAELIKIAKNISESLRKEFACDYDDTQSIGRRYRRQDEIGTPCCVTVDFQTIEDHAVTIRNRDTTDQIRVPIVGLIETLNNHLTKLKNY
jgi:glycyl-tRNA synthetase